MANGTMQILSDLPEVTGGRWKHTIYLDLKTVNMNNRLDAWFEKPLVNDLCWKYLLRHIGRALYLGHPKIGDLAARSSFTGWLEFKLGSRWTMKRGVTVIYWLLNSLYWLQDSTDLLSSTAQYSTRLTNPAFVQDSDNHSVLHST